MTSLLEETLSGMSTSCKQLAVDKWHAFLKPRDKTPLKFLSLTELTRKKVNLLEIIREHEAIQCRIEQVEMDKELEDEIADVLKIYDKQDTLVDQSS